MSPVPEGSTSEAAFPAGFFDRDDESPDAGFYGSPRLVTHIDDGAVAAVGTVYAELVTGPRVLDFCSSWLSHFRTAPAQLTVLGMNAAELAANATATDRVVRDLNVDPAFPFPDTAFDDAVCCVSVDYLTRPVTVLADLARVVRPGGRVVFTWSDRCFPTKAVHGWLAADEADRPGIVEAYLAAAGGWDPAISRTVLPERRGPFAPDPLWATWATRSVA